MDKSPLPPPPKRRKRELFELILVLHGAGLTTATALAKVLCISDTYARRIALQLGLRLAPKDRRGLLELLDSELRARVELFGNPNK